MKKIILVTFILLTQKSFAIGIGHACAHASAHVSAHPSAHISESAHVSPHVTGESHPVIVPMPIAKRNGCEKDEKGNCK
ncbi:MAG TPA: hypothetical protein VKG26_09490 [Bacteroidia bacterium]|nr:hypothetical protein [Bacteroidia bacterium]